MSTVSVAIIMSAILKLMPNPSPKWDESQDVFESRMRLIAEKIHDETEGRRQLSFAIVVMFWGESRFSPLIHAGVHRGDSGKAICLGQIHQGKLTREEWESLVGTTPEATAKCVHETARILKSSWWHCHDLSPQWGYPEAMVLYGTGRTCKAEETQWENIFKDRASKWKSLVVTVTTQETRK